MTLKLSAPSIDTATLRLLAAGRGPIAIKARAEIQARMHTALRHARAS